MPSYLIVIAIFRNRSMMVGQCDVVGWSHYRTRMKPPVPDSRKIEHISESPSLKSIDSAYDTLTRKSDVGMARHRAFLRTSSERLGSRNGRIPPQRPPPPSPVALSKVLLLFLLLFLPLRLSPSFTMYDDVCLHLTQLKTSRPCSTVFSQAFLSSHSSSVYFQSNHHPPFILLSASVLASHAHTASTYFSEVFFFRFPPLLFTPWFFQFLSYRTLSKVHCSLAAWSRWWGSSWRYRSVYHIIEVSYFLGVFSRFWFHSLMQSCHND